MIRKDALWKGIIENLAPDFVAFFYPEIYEQMDKSRKVNFLDKELASLQPDSETRQRHADKLLRVYLRGGEERWILIHVEVQGYNDVHFSERMFQYFYRIFDKYGIAPLGLAIYTDRAVHLHQSEFYHEHFGTKIVYIFNSFSIISHEPEDLRQPGNPFGFVLEVARRALDDYEDDAAIIQSKIGMIRYYLSHGLDKETIRNLMDFVLYYLHFENQDSTRIFEKELNKLQLNQETMGIREAILKDAEEQGLERGLQRGLQKGLEQGLEQGQRKGVEKIILKAYSKGFSISEIAQFVDLQEYEVQEILNANDRLKKG